MLIYDVYLPDYREVSLPIVISKLQPMLFIQMELNHEGSDQNTSDIQTRGTKYSYLMSHF